MNPCITVDTSLLPSYQGPDFLLGLLGSDAELVMRIPVEDFVSRNTWNGEFVFVEDGEVEVQVSLAHTCLYGMLGETEGVSLYVCVHSPNTLARRVHC